MQNPDPRLTPVVADEVKTSTCYMCACRCGIRVYLKDGTVRFIEGNPDHPVNKGVLCAKGSAGIMQHYSPARLTKPLRRVGERGSGEFEEIEWDEALGLAAQWLGRIRESDPKRLAFFTGRDQSQALTGWWAQQFGTQNYAAHGGFCSVNMAAAGLYSIGGSFWEFGEPDWDNTRYFLMFGVAEDHDSNPIKMGLGRLKSRAKAKFVSVNPVRTGYSSIADEWVGIRPGTDGLFVGSLIQQLIKAEAIDFDYLIRYTNAPYLVVQDSGAENQGLFLRDQQGKPLCFDGASQAVRSIDDATSPLLVGNYQHKGQTVVPVLQLIVARYLDPSYEPSVVAEKTGVPEAQIRRIASELAQAAFEQEVILDIPWTDWKGQKHERMIGRPVSMHAMRGISAHSNGFHTCRAIHLLQMLLGSIDVPGGFRYKAPYPKTIPPGNRPGKTTEKGAPLHQGPLGFPLGPEDLLVNDDGSPQRVDKAFSWEYPLAAHGMMHMVINNAAKGDPYPIDTLFMYMANMAWNSSMSIKDTLNNLTAKDEATGEYKIPHIIYSDAFYSETVPYADLILPDTTYLERWDCISILDRPIGEADAAGDAIRQPVVKPDRDVRPFQDVLLELGARLNLPGMVNDDGTALYPGGYSDYLCNHKRGPGGSLSGWRGENGDKEFVGEANPNQLERYIENGCFWHREFKHEQRYFKFANQSYLELASEAGWIPSADPIRLELYSETLQKFRLAAMNYEISMPEDARQRIKEFFDPIPFWYMPFEEQLTDNEALPLHALTQRPMHMYHSWGSQNPWLRQITAQNYLYMHDQLASKLGVADFDWVKVASSHGEIRVQVKIMNGVNPHTVWTWNAIGKRAGAWNLSQDAPEAKKGFLLNHLISELLPPKKSGARQANADPVTGQASWFDLRVKIEKCEADSDVCGPQLDSLATRGAQPVSVSLFGEDLQGKGQGSREPSHQEFVGNQDCYESPKPK
ncbi:MAG: molybdopterin oxidoreductase family protein [Pseudomonadota bacterium]